MEKFEFYSNNLENLTEITKNALSNVNKHDPTSIYYERHLIRPKIPWFRIISHVTASTLIFLVITRLLFLIKKDFMISIITSCLIFLFYLLANLKKILICSIQIYQCYAPTSIRMKCRFEPSCSQYMILSIKKYGAIKGSFKGIKRLRRCKIGNGGYDFP